MQWEALSAFHKVGRIEIPFGEKKINQPPLFSHFAESAYERGTKEEQSCTALRSTT